MAGMAISADTQCSIAAVAGPIWPSTPVWPAQMPTDISITLPAANPATARRAAASARCCPAPALSAVMSNGTSR